METGHPSTRVVETGLYSHDSCRHSIKDAIKETAFHPPGVNKLVVSCNQMAAITIISGCAVW